MGVYPFWWDWTRWVGTIVGTIVGKARSCKQYDPWHRTVLPTVITHFDLIIWVLPHSLYHSCITLSTLILLLFSAIDNNIFHPAAIPDQQALHHCKLSLLPLLLLYDHLSLVYVAFVIALRSFVIGLQWFCACLTTAFCLHTTFFS